MSIYAEVESLRVKATAYQEAALFWKKAHDALQQAYIDAQTEYHRRLERYHGMEAALEASIAEIEELRSRLKAINRALGVEGQA